MMQAQKSMMQIEVVGGTNPGRYNKISNESAYNMIVSDDSLIPYAGYIQENNLGGNTRGIYLSTLVNKLFLVVLNDLISLDSELNKSVLGEINTNNGNVYFAENGNSQIGITDLVTYYVYNYSTNILISVDIGFAPSFLTATNGYIFGSISGSNQFRYSNVNDAITWDARNSGTLGNDLVNCVQSLGEMVFVLGSKLTKIWRNVGSAINPYKLDPSVNILYGTVNADSVASGFDRIVWVGTNEDLSASIMVSQGGVATTLSTDGIDYKLSNLKNPNDCVAFLFKQDGHIFYQATWQTDNFTLVYDFTSQKFLYATDENLDFHIAKRVEHFNDNYYFISFNDSFLYELTTNATDYAGAIIPRIRITRPFRLPTYGFFRIKRLQLILESGVSPAPMHIDLSISTDGGESFGATVRQDLSPLGQRRYITQWFQLGWGNDWTFQFRFYGIGRFVILGCYAEVS